MDTYRSEHTENGSLFVYLWVKKGAAAPAGKETAKSKPFGAHPERVIWAPVITSALVIDAEAVAGAGPTPSLGLAVRQLPARTRHQEAIAWIDTPEGRAWSGGAAAQLIVMQLQGADSDGARG